MSVVRAGHGSESIGVVFDIYQQMLIKAENSMKGEEIPFYPIWYLATKSKHNRLPFPGKRKI